MSKLKLLAIFFLIQGLSISSFAVSYKCVTTGTAQVAKEFIIQNAKNFSSYASGLVQNKAAYISLDGKKKIMGVVTTGSSSVEHYIEFEAKDGKYTVIVRLFTKEEQASGSYVDVLPTGTRENTLKHWVTCSKIEDTADPNLAEINSQMELKKKQDEEAKKKKAQELTPEQIRLKTFCHLSNLDSVTQIPNWIDEKPIIKAEGDYDILTYPSGAVVKSHRQMESIESFTLPPGLKCK